MNFIKKLRLRVAQLIGEGGLLCMDSNQKRIIGKFPFERVCLVFAPNRKDIGSPELTESSCVPKSIRAMNECVSSTKIVSVIQRLSMERGAFLSYFV